MTLSRLTLIAIAGASVALIAGATPADARGCNGVVNPFVWGCAPWDNNNGPKYPYYKKTKISIPKGKAQVFNQNGVQMVKDLRTGAVHPLIGHAGGNIIATGGLN